MRRTSTSTSTSSTDDLPDVRDGLTRLERTILIELEKAQRELGETHVPSALLYGRVAEQIEVSQRDFQRTLVRLVQRRA